MLICLENLACCFQVRNEDIFTNIKLETFIYYLADYFCALV